MKFVVKAAEGGEDAKLLAKDLFNSYTKMWSALG
jgi:protein subunit release factor A